MIIDQPGIFSGGHTLKPGEALRQVRDLLATNPTSELTQEFRAELLGIVELADARKVLLTTRRGKVRTPSIPRKKKKINRKK